MGGGPGRSTWWGWCCVFGELWCAGRNPGPPWIFLNSKRYLAYLPYRLCFMEVRTLPDVCFRVPCQKRPPVSSRTIFEQGTQKQTSSPTKFVILIFWPMRGQQTSQVTMYTLRTLGGLSRKIIRIGCPEPRPMTADAVSGGVCHRFG